MSDEKIGVKGNWLVGRKKAIGLCHRQKTTYMQISSRGM